MKLDLNKEYNFLVHKQGVTVLDDTEPIGVISIKDFLNCFQSNTMPMFSAFETNLPYQVLHSDPINKKYLIKFPPRDQTITLSLTKDYTGHKIGINSKHKIKIIDVKLPEHYWYYDKNEYHLLVKRGDEFYKWLQIAVNKKHPPKIIRYQ